MAPGSSDNNANSGPEEDYNNKIHSIMSDSMQKEYDATTKWDKSEEDDEKDKISIQGILLVVAMIIVSLLMVIFIIRKLVQFCITWRETSKEQEQLERQASNPNSSAQLMKKSGAERTSSLDPQINIGNRHSTSSGSTSRRAGSLNNSVVRSRGDPTTAYVAVAPGMRPGAPCLNCNLISMGEAVSYADGSCPQCGGLAT